MESESHSTYMIFLSCLYRKIFETLELLKVYVSLNFILILIVDIW